jgi:predicted metalloprotease
MAKNRAARRDCFGDRSDDARADIGRAAGRVRDHELHWLGGKVHVQNLLGILPKARQIQTEGGRASANHLQVQIELQASARQSALRAYQMNAVQNGEVHQLLPNSSRATR